MEHFEKSIIPVIESVYPSFTPLERTVADFFIHNTDESDLSARHVSELLYVRRLRSPALRKNAATRATANLSTVTRKV